MTKLTKKLVDGLEKSGKEQFVWDSELQGFGVRVQTSGRKTYMVRYRAKDGANTQRKMTIGRVSDMPPEKARELARKVFALVAEGIDPMAQRREEEDLPTMADLEERYTREHSKPFKKKNSQETDEKNWRLYVLPEWRDKRVKDITEAMVMKMHGGFSEKQATGNQVLALLSKAFNLCEKWGWRDRNTNPCHFVKKYPTKEKELILTVDEIARLNESMETMHAHRILNNSAYDLFRLLMFTGCRLREIMHAEKAWVDRERKLLLLPDSKTGQRKIALSAPAMAIIEGMDDKSKWLIPGKVPNEPMITPYKAWKAVKVMAKLPMELRIHDLRHTAGSLGHMAGLTQKQIQIMLGHKQMSTTERYLHGAGDESAVADKLSNVITGKFGVAA